MKTFVIGDIHGHYQELMALIRQLPINLEVDRVVFLGDYIDRGPQSYQVVDQLMTWQCHRPDWVFLMGNHEAMLFDALRYGNAYLWSWWEQGGRETVHSYGLREPEELPGHHLQWLESLPLHFEDEHYIYVHAGLVPGVAPDDNNMDDMLWIREEFLESNYDWGKKVIFGHTPNVPSLEPWVHPNKIGIDTAICRPGRHKLTAVELPTETFYFQEAVR